MNNTFKEKFKNTQPADYLQDIRMTDDVWEGTRAVKRGGYLQKAEKESRKNYNERVERALFVPLFKRSILTSVGKAFMKPLIADIPKEMEILLQNIDHSGTTLEAFAKDVLTDAIKYGISYILVDYPIIENNRTLADERAMGALPYLQKINPANMLELKTANHNGRTLLIYARILIDDDKVLELSYTDKGEIKADIFVRDGENVLHYDTNFLTGVETIPIIPVYAGKVGDYVGRPLLMDMVHANIAHFRKKSDIDTALHYAAMPILVLKGRSKNYDPATGRNDNDIVISPNSGIDVGEDGDVEWLELNGSGISIYKEDLKDLEDSISMMGLELTTSKKPFETATGRLIDEQNSQSILEGICIDLESALTTSFKIMAQYMNIDKIIINDINIDIDTSTMITPNSGVDIILNIYKEGIITATEALKEIKERAILVTNPVGQSQEQ